MKNLKKFIKEMISDESGQGATEYILLLVVVVAIAVMFRKQIQEVISAKLGEVSGSINSFSTGGQ